MSKRIVLTIPEELYNRVIHLNSQSTIQKFLGDAIENHVHKFENENPPKCGDKVIQTSRNMERNTIEQPENHGKEYIKECIIRWEQLEQRLEEKFNRDI